MISLELETKQIKTLRNRIKNFLSSGNSFDEQGLLELAHDGVSYLTEYPPLTKGNFPPAPYWERGKGLIGGQGQLLQQSRQYGNSADRWNYEISQDGTTVTVEASSPDSITYAPYLGDPNTQSYFHQRNGWRTTDDAYEYLDKPQKTRGFYVNVTNKIAQLLKL